MTKASQRLTPNLQTTCPRRKLEGRCRMARRKGCRGSALQIGGRQLISIGSTAILARPVTPDDYGLLGMVTTLTALLGVFRHGFELGHRPAQRASQARVSNLFWLNAVAGLLLWGLCILLAPGLRRSMPGRVAAVTIALGATFVLGGSPALALMTRRMQFKQMARSRSPLWQPLRWPALPLPLWVGAIGRW